MRLKQNITQQALAEESGVSLSSIKKIEKGEIGSFDSLLRLLRMLGKLDVLQPLVEEEQLSPGEYYEYVQKATARQRKRASRKIPARNETVLGRNREKDGTSGPERLVYEPEFHS